MNWNIDIISVRNKPNKNKLSRAPNPAQIAPKSRRVLQDSDDAERKLARLIKDALALQKLEQSRLQAAHIVLAEPGFSIPARIAAQAFHQAE